MEPWQKYPYKPLTELANREASAKHWYRPVYSMSKSFATRLGAPTRALGLSLLSDDGTLKEDILREEDGELVGQFYESNSRQGEETTVLDPFFGGGTIPAEFNRLGADVIGYELNPVLWFNAEKVFDPYDVEAIQAQATAILETLESSFGNLYKTTFDDVGTVPGRYWIRVRTLPCRECGDSTKLFSDRILYHKGDTTVVYCPNDSCQDRVFRMQADNNEDDEITCPSCSTVFKPKSGNTTRGTFVCQQGHKNNVREVQRTLNTPPTTETIAIVSKVDELRFKSPDTADRQKLAAARDQYSEIGDDLNVPNQPLPESDAFQRLREANLTHHAQLFTPRQTLVFSELVDSLKQSAEGIQSEYLLLSFFSQIEYNTALNLWNVRRGLAEPLFRTISPRFPNLTVELNPFKDTRGGLNQAIQQVIRGKEYCSSPSERTITDDGTREISIEGEDISREPPVDLTAGSATELQLERESVDLIVTDPPYVDTVQFGPLLEVFYVWYQQVLKDRYDAFSNTQPRSVSEIVVDETRSKDPAFYRQALTNAFAEMHRCLDREGQFVCYYHISDVDGWKLLVEAMLKAGFRIQAAFPVTEIEDSTSDGFGQKTLSYDVFVFADKERSTETRSFQELQQDLYADLEEMIKEEQTYHSTLSNHALRTILMGRGLTKFSKHFPNVEREGDSVDPSEAVDIVLEILNEEIL